MNEKTVLICDDNAINRKLLKKILSSEYDVEEAENGADGLKKVEELGGKLAAILLDLVMPIMSGYDFLKKFSELENSKNIPVIVVTGQKDTDNELEVLKLGACDFVTKPYVPEIILFRLKNAIIRSQLTAFNELKYRIEYDVLTGIYNRDKFLSMTDEMFLEHPNDRFTLIRFDINRFHLINSYFGTAVGDDFLVYIGKCLSDLGKAHNDKMTYGRIEADIFAICIPTDSCERIESLVGTLNEQFEKFPIAFDISASFGIYIVEDNTISSALMYDKATVAAKNCKGSYLITFSYYTESLWDKALGEQEIVNDMARAIENGEFEVWYQPVRDIQSDTTSGAEALVRWRHPTKGLIPPNKFIPVFEHNGLITELDFYVWSKVCADIRKWRDKGLDIGHVSVNISRVDLSDTGLLEKICVLTNKYCISPEKLWLEITESAYTDNPEAISEAVSRFQAAGFTIMMDDFGSGYSSLAVLKDIEVDVLKIDMRFFTLTEILGRGKKIVASVVKMAESLTLPVVAEGVERADQVEYLREIGCQFVQGYYFAKPMPHDDFEIYMAGANVRSKDLANA